MGGGNAAAMAARTPYISGRTPNPCKSLVTCYKWTVAKDLLEQMLEEV
jgi:hypothetical protein